MADRGPDTEARQPGSALDYVEMREFAEHVLSMGTSADPRATSLARDVVALTEELTGLREQLDAARPVIEQLAWLADAHKSWEVSLTHADIPLNAARAALGVVGPPADTGSGASAAPDGTSEAK